MHKSEGEPSSIVVIVSCDLLFITDAPRDRVRELVKHTTGKSASSGLRGTRGRSPSWRRRRRSRKAATRLQTH